MPRKTYCLTEKGLQSLRAANRQTQPWKFTSGPKTLQGKRMSSLNAFKHGGRCKQTFRLPALPVLAPLTSSFNIHNSTFIIRLSHASVRLAHALHPSYDSPMPRIWLFAAFAALALTSVLWARQGVVHLKDGSELWGDVDQSDPDNVTITLHNVRETMSRADVESVEFFASLEEEFQVRLGRLKSDDVPGRLELARWADALGQYDLARQAAADALAIDSTNPDAREMMRTIGVQAAVVHSSTSTTPPQTRPAVVITPTSAPAPPKPYVTLDQVNEIRQLELKPDEPFKVSFQNDVKKRFLARGDIDSTSFYALSVDDQARKILATGDAALANDVRIVSDPASMAEFRAHILPYVLGGCAVSGCHNPLTPVGGFALFVKDDSPQAAYTNFYMLQSYRKAPATGGEPVRVMIDRIHPELSLLVQYGLPQKIAAPPHPAALNFHPPFPGRNDSRYQALIYWMVMSLRPEGDDFPGIHYQPPWATPTTAPSK
jgi:hypothetical protein